MSVYHTRKGILRIYDSSEIFPALADASVFTEIGGVATDDSADARTDNGLLTVFWTVAGASVFIGRTTPFARVKVDLDVLASADTGALVAKYFNGTTMVTLTVTDGTASGGNTMRQDGYIYFDPPADWATGANAFQVGLNADEYYISLEPTTTPATDPEADVLWPVDGQFFEVAYVQADLTGPEGRPRPEETLVMNRENLDTLMHYQTVSERAIEEGVEVSFSALLDSSVNRTALKAALACGNPGSTNWGSTGVSTKTDTSYIDVDGNSVQTSALSDTEKKTVAILAIWEATASTKVGRAWHECWFDPGSLEVSDGEEGLTISASGLCYGAIEQINQFAYKY